MVAEEVMPLIERVNEGKDFAGIRLVNADLSRRLFRNCNFDRADMEGANCSFSDFTGSSFMGTNCRETNFHRATLAATKFEPRDCYGMTISLTCSTFKNAQLGQLWWYAWLMFLSMTFPGEGPVKENLKDRLLALIGAERYVKLNELFRRREF